MLRDLNAELQASSAASGLPLEWSATEQVLIDQILDGIDRKSDLAVAYAAAADEPKLRIKLSVEMRLLEQAVARLLKMVSTEPAPQKSQKHVRAARARWDRHA